MALSFIAYARAMQFASSTSVELPSSQLRSLPGSYFQGVSEYVLPLSQLKVRHV
jgi:hypothetical protein